MKYKQMIQLGGVASTESLGTIIPPLPMDGEFTNVSLDEAQDAGRELERVNVAVEHLNNIAGKLVKLRASMLSNAAQGKLSRVSVEAYGTAIESLVRPLGLSGITVSAEGFEHDHDSSLQYSAEGVTEVLKNILKRMLELINTAIEKAKDYIEKFFDSTEKLKTRYESLTNKVDGLGGRSITTPQIQVQPSVGEWLMTNDGAINVSAAVDGYAQFIGEIVLGYPQRVADFVRSVTGVMRGWATNPLAATNDQAFDGIEPPLLRNVNPNTGIKEDFVYGPYRVHVNMSGIPSVDFTEIDLFNGQEPESITVSVAQAQVMKTTVAKAIVTIGQVSSAKNQILAIQQSMEEYAKSIEALSTMEIKDEQAVDDLRNAIVGVNTAVRSWADFPMRAGAKVMHGMSAAESVISKMITEGYGKTADQPGATGNGGS